MQSVVLTFSGSALSLHRVFHGIRFKVMKESLVVRRAISAFYPIRQKNFFVWMVVSFPQLSCTQIRTSCILPFWMP